MVPYVNRTANPSLFLKLNRFSKLILKQVLLKIIHIEQKTNRGITGSNHEVNKCILTGDGGSLFRLFFSSLFLADWVVGEITGEQIESELSVTLQPFDERQEPVLPDDATFNESADVTDETVPLTATPFSNQASQTDQASKNPDASSTSFTSESVAEPQRASGLFPGCSRIRPRVQRSGR